MTFHDIFKFWRGQGLLNQTLNLFIGMLDRCHSMYTTATTLLWDTSQDEKKKTDIYKRDIEVNLAVHAP